MKAFFLSSLFLVFFFSGISQNIAVVEEPGITSLMNKYLAKNAAEETVKGWRIQIVTTPDRREMQSTKNKFESLYPGMSLDWKHVPPYYKVVVGAWRDKISCDAFLKELMREFRLSTPVVDNIRKTDLLN